MTDKLALLANLVTLAESGYPNFKLEISRTFYDPVDFIAYKKVRVNGVELFDVEFDHILGAAPEWPVLRHETLEKYMPPLKIIFPKFETTESE